MATNKRARQLERERLMRQAQRRTQRAERQRRFGYVIIGVIVLAGAGTGIGLLASGTGNGAKDTVAATSPTAGASVSPTPTASASAAPATKICKFQSDGQPGGPGLPPDKKATGSHVMTIALTQGVVKIALSPKAPCTVTSFQYLASKKFFDKTPCPRVVNSGLFVLQCGDPTGTGSGGPGYTIPDENLTGATYPAGTLAMANTGQPHSGGSQFFIVYKASQLPPSYTPFGKVTSGLDVVAKIGAAGNDGSNQAGGGKPKQAVTIKTLTVS